MTRIVRLTNRGVLGQLLTQVRNGALVHLIRVRVVITVTVRVAVVILRGGDWLRCHVVSILVPRATAFQGDVFLVSQTSVDQMLHGYLVDQFTRNSIASDSIDHAVMGVKVYRESRERASSFNRIEHISFA